MTYPLIEVNLDKITQNTRVMTDLCACFKIQVAGVTKVACGSPHVAQAMLSGGVRQIADARLENLVRLRENGVCGDLLLLRIPMLSQAPDVVAYADLSLNSELEVIGGLSREALRRNKKHKIILMIDVGDLREGVLPEDAPEVVERILAMDGVTLEGIGTNLSCYGGIIPSLTNMSMLVEVADRLESRFKIHLNIISGGNTGVVSLVREGKIHPRINHLRIGEGILLGVNSLDRQPLPDMAQDAFVLKAEIIELNQKPTVPVGEQGQDAFGGAPKFKDRGVRARAILGLGREDIDVANIAPLDEQAEVLGASSDHLLVDIQNCRRAYRVGEVMAFRMGYSALLAAMTSPYVAKSYNAPRRPPARRHVSILGVPTAIGGSDAGVALAPQAVREAGLVRALQALDYEVADLGDLPVDNSGADSKEKFGLVADLCRAIAGRVGAICRSDSMPLVIGGDHSLTIGVLAGLRPVRDPIGLIYFDAHGDYNTDRTTPSNNIHGMVVSACVGLGHPQLVNCCDMHPKVAQENVVLIGSRDLDQGERENLRQSRLRVFTMEDIDLLGMREVISQTIAHLAHCAGGVHVSLDLDVLDEKDAPGVSLPVRGGISYRETHLALEMLSRSGLPFSMDVVEINPERDTRNGTSRMAVEFVASLFGKRIIK